MYKTQNLVKCQGTLRIKTQSIRKVDRNIRSEQNFSKAKTTAKSYFLVVE